MRIKALVCLVLLAVALASATAAEENTKVSLLNKFELGQTIAYDLKLSGSGTTTMTPEGADAPAVTVPMEFTGVMTMSQKVVQMYDDGSAAIEMISDRLDMNIRAVADGEPQDMNLTITGEKMTMSGPQGEQEIDLAEAGMDSAMMGMDMRMRLTPRGEIVWFSAEGMERLSQMTGMDLSQMMRPSETPFPDREVAPGDSWEYEMEFPLPGVSEEVQIKMNAKLLAIDMQDGCPMARVAVNGDIDLSGMTMAPPGGPGQPPAQITFDEMTEQLKGEFVFDVNRGVMSQAAYDIALQTSMKAPAGPQGGLGTIRTEMSIRAELTERK